MRRAVFVFLSLCLVLLTGLPVQAQKKTRGLLSLPVKGTSVPLYARSYALVIGIDAYKKGWPPLSGARSDAKAIARELTQRGFEVSLKLDLISRQLKQVLEDFIYDKGQHKDARLFIWFAGHGHTVNGEGYLVPSDAPHPDTGVAFRRKALSLRRFGEYMREARARHVLSVFDSCFSGTVFSSARSAPPSVITLAATKRVRQFISSGEAKQEVSDDGAFRKLFLDALRGADLRADMNRDGYLMGSELGLFLHQEVTNLTSNQQTPRYGKLRARGYNRGDFVFRVGKGATQTAAPANTGDSEIMAMRKRLARLEAELTKRNPPTVKRSRFTPGTIFDDCNGAGWCPSMVVVPKGSFMMGSKGGGSNERPVHRVTFDKPFAVGRFEVTWDEWEACVSDGGCDNGPIKKAGGDNGWGKGKRPVIEVSWNDAKSYLKWLSKKTGKPYRLLTEAEWEYVARGNKGDRKYWWGNGIGRNKANCDGCGSKWDNKKTAPVGSFDPNGFKVHDMHGNVWEWVEDCYKGSYKGAPTDGSANATRSCVNRVLRGGSWLGIPRFLRSADRYRSRPGIRFNDSGFRVARSLPSPRTRYTRTNACIAIGRNIPRRIEMTVGTTFCDAAQRNEAKVVKIYNRGVRFSVNGEKMTCSQGRLCAFDWPVKPLFRVKARADKAKGIKPQATMLPR